MKIEKLILCVVAFIGYMVLIEISQLSRLLHANIDIARPRPIFTSLVMFCTVGLITIPETAIGCHGARAVCSKVPANALGSISSITSPASFPKSRIGPYQKSLNSLSCTGGLLEIALRHSQPCQ